MPIPAILCHVKCGKGLEAADGIRFDEYARIVILLRGAEINWNGQATADRQLGHSTAY
jgi:hypothetical protein